MTHIFRDWIQALHQALRNLTKTNVLSKSPPLELASLTNAYKIPLLLRSYVPSTNLLTTTAPLSPSSSVGILQSKATASNSSIDSKHGHRSYRNHRRLSPATTSQQIQPSLPSRTQSLRRPRHRQRRNHLIVHHHRRLRIRHIRVRNAAIHRPKHHALPRRQTPVPA